MLMILELAKRTDEHTAVTSILKTNHRKLLCVFVSWTVEIGQRIDFSTDYH